MQRPWVGEPCQGVGSRMSEVTLGWGLVSLGLVGGRGQPRGQDHPQSLDNVCVFSPWDACILGRHQPLPARA